MHDASFLAIDLLVVVTLQQLDGFLKRQAKDRTSSPASSQAILVTLTSSSGRSLSGFTCDYRDCLLNHKEA
jgi:hypothetical protein